MLYCVEKEIITSEELGTYVTYGIGLYDRGERVRIIHDISISEAKVKALCNSCNRLELDPVHIDDVVEDIL